MKGFVFRSTDQPRKPQFLIWNILITYRKYFLFKSALVIKIHGAVEVYEKSDNIIPDYKKIVDVPRSIFKRALAVLKKQKKLTKKKDDILKIVF